MAVNTLNQYRLAVDEQLSTLDFYMTEADAKRNNLNNFIVLVNQSQRQRIKIGRLSCPGRYVKLNEIPTKARIITN